MYSNPLTKRNNPAICTLKNVLYRLHDEVLSEILKIINGNILQKQSKKTGLKQT